MSNTQSPTRTNIIEANKHLKMLYDKVDELQGLVHEQEEQLQKKDREFQTSVTNVTVTKNSEIAELKNTIETLRIQNEKLKGELFQKDVVLEKLKPKGLVADKLVQHRNALCDVLLLIDSLTVDPNADTDSGVHSSRLTKDVTAPVDISPENGVDADESDQSLEEHFAKSSRLTHVVKKNRPRHFSISDDDLEDPDTVLRTMRRDKEFFL